MSKDFLNTTGISEENIGIPGKQKFLTNPTPSAVTRYVCISKDAHGSTHSQPLAFWESVRNDDPVVTQHVCCFEESGSDVSSSIASTNVVLKKQVAVIPADAVPAFTGFCSVGGLSQKRHRKPEHVTEKQHPGAHIRSCREQQKSTRITPHTWREQIQIIKKEDAVAAGSGVVDTITASAFDSKGLSVSTKLVTSETEAQSSFTQYTSDYTSGDIINGKSITTSVRNFQGFEELHLGINDPEVHSKSVKYEPEFLRTDKNKTTPEHLDTSIKVKSDGSKCRTSTRVHELNSTNFETKSAQDTIKRKSFHIRNKTREYILQQKQKRKERFLTEQSKKIMEDEIKKIKLQTLREKSLKIVKTNVKKSLSKKINTEKLNNLEPGNTSDHHEKVDDLQAPAVTVNTKSISHKSVMVTKYKVSESVPSQVPLATKCDDDIDVAQSALKRDSNEGNSNKSSRVDLEVKDNQQKKNEPDKSSLCDSNGGNSNKSSSVDLKLKDNQQMRSELDLKIHAVARALSAELESSILCSSYDLSDKVTEDGYNLSLQRPLLRLRDTASSRQAVPQSMENRVANIDGGIRNIGDSPPTKLKRYDHTEQMKSLEKKMELANHTISMLRENNIIKSVEESNRGESGIFKRREKVQKENSTDLEKKSRQKAVESPQQYFSKRSAFPFHPRQHSEITEHTRKLLKKLNNTSKKFDIQNHSITSTEMVFNHIPQIGMEHSSETSNIEGRENLQSTPSKHLDKVTNLNDLPSSFTHNLQTIENNISVSPVEQKTNSKRRREYIKSKRTTGDDCYKKSDKKSQLQTTAFTANDFHLLKDSEFKVQPSEKLKKLLQEHSNQIDHYAVNPPLTPDVTTKSPGAAAEIFKRVVEREKRERAATQIQALYRGHSIRKKTAALKIGTRSNGDVQKGKLQDEECQDRTERETRNTEDLGGSKFNTGELTDWLQLEPVKPCPYNVMTAVRQKLLALKKVSDAKIETKAANVCTEQTLADDEGAVKNSMSTQHRNKEVCTSGSWVEENSIIQKNTIDSVAEKRKKVQTVKLHGAKEYPSSNVEERSDNRKTYNSNKSYVFSEEAGWIENEGPKQNQIESLQLSTINESNITRRSRNQGKTFECSLISSVIGSDTECLNKCNLKHNNEDLALPDVHLVRKRRRSENGTVSIPSNFEDSCSSGAKQRENSLPTSKADWIEASVHSASAQSSFPTNSDPHNKESIAESKSENSSRNSKHLKTKPSINISDRGQAEKSSTQRTELPHETETKMTVSACSGSSANGIHHRHKVRTLLESGKMMPPEALHLQFQAEINLLESLEKSRLQLAQIEGLHALSLIQHRKHLKADEPEQPVMSDHQQHRTATTHDKIDGFDENRKEFNAVVESMRKGAALSGAEPEDIDWLTFSGVSNSVKPSNIQATCEKRENELFQTGKSVLKNCEMNFPGENQEKQNAKYSYDSSFTSVSEDVSGHTSSTKSKPSELNSVSVSIITKTLDTALKKGRISKEAYCKYEKLIQEEATRSRDQAILLDTTERALIDRFVADLKTLQRNKRQLKQCGKENLIPSIKKKKRALILKMEHDREEIKRLRKTYMEASKEWKNLLFQHLTLTKCNMADSEILGKEQQERLLTSTTSISTELEIPVNSDAKKSSVPGTSSLQTEVSSSIQTKLSQHSGQSKRSAGSDSWNSNKKTENSRRVQKNIDFCTDLTKTVTAADKMSSEKRHSLLPSKRLWSHDEISDWQHSTGEDKRRVRPFIYHRDNSISPMRVFQTEKQHTNLNSTDSLESSSATICFDRDSFCGRNSSGIAVPVIGSSSNNKNSSSSLKATGTISSVEELCKHSDTSITVPTSSLGMKRQSSGSDESIMFSQGDTPSEQSDLEGRVSALREQLRRREQEAEKLKKLQRRKARREELKATEQSLLKQIQVLDSYIKRTKEQLKENVNTSTLHAVKPKIKQPCVRTEKSSTHILDKTKEKPKPHEQTEQNSNRVLDKEKYISLPDDTSHKSVSNGTSTEIPTVIVSEHTANSTTFLPDDTSNITYREITTSEDDDLKDEIVSVLGSCERRSEAPDSTQDYVSNELNNYSKDSNSTIKTSSIKSVSSLSSDHQSSVRVKHSDPFQLLDSYVIQTKDELMQGFNSSSPVLAGKSNIKQPGVWTEQSSKSFVDKQKEISEQRDQTEENSNLVLDKTQYESPPDHTSQKSISSNITSEIQTMMSSEQAANSNSRTSREAHTSEDDNHEDNIVSVSSSFERRKEVLDSSVDYVSNDENNCSKNKDDNLKASSFRETSSVSSYVQSAVGVKHTESECSLTRGCSGAQSIIPAVIASGDHFLEEDREISEVLIDSTFVMNNSEYSSTEECNDSKNENAQESCVSSSLKPLDSLYEEKSDDSFSKRSDSLVKNVITQETDSKTCTSTTINEELPEIEETSMSLQHIPDFSGVQKTLTVDSPQHEIMGKTESDLVSAPQSVSDTECNLTSEIKNASPDTLTAGREEIKDKKQVMLSSTENQSEPLQKDALEESALNNYSNSIDGGGDVAEFCHSSDGSICTESHPVPVQLNSTFVIVEQEHTTQNQIVAQSKIVIDSKKNENKMEKLKLADSITESIMLQLVKESLVLPNSRQKDYGYAPNVNAPRKTVLSDAHKFSKIPRLKKGLAKEIQPNSRTKILDDPEKQEILIAEQKPKPTADASINNNTFLLDESTKSEKNTSELVDEMLNHCLKNATTDVLNIYNKKMSNSDRLCVPSEASKGCPQSPSIEISGLGNDSDLRLLDQDNVCKSSEITNVTLENNNIHLSVNDSFHNVKTTDVSENGLQDTVSFTSPDGKRDQELDLSVGDLLKPVSEHSTCEKFKDRTDIEPQETERGDVSSGCLNTDESDSQLHQRDITADEVVMPEDPLPDGFKSKVGAQNGNKLKEISHLQKVEVKGSQSVNNETFPPGWFDEDLDLSNSWREAEQLRLQQLHIEQEIRRLEEQQHQQQALVLVREIPDKPPPPYTPRGTTLHSSSPLYPAPAIGASAPRHRLIELVAEATPLLTSSGAPPMLPPEDFCAGYNSSIRRFIYDLGRSLLNEAVSVPGTDDEYGEEASPQQITVKRSPEAVRAHVMRRATALLHGSAGAGPNSAGKLRRLAVGPRWRRRDHVDELLVREARDEEPGWIDYRRDETHLRNETACALLCDLLDDTVTAITTAIARRMAAKTRGVV